MKEIMRIGILTTGQIEEDKRLIDAAKARGHEATPLELLNCSINVCLNNSGIFHDGQNINDMYDIIIPRLDVSYTDYGLNILRQFQAIGTYVTDKAHAVELGRDKLRCFQYLLRHNVPFPTTGLADSIEDVKNIVQEIGGAPFIIKLIEGTQGTGVFLAHDMKEAENIILTLKQFNAPVIVQKFISESAGKDLRCFVVGDKIVAVVRRESQDGDFRANIALGGHSFEEKLSKEEEKVVLNATKAIGLNIAGVDLIRSNEGPLIIEINVSPDFAGEQKIDVTGIDVAGLIIDYAAEGKKQFDEGKGVWLQEQQDA